MTTLTGFPPVLPAVARVLILGSMPGAASLQEAQYYAHPRNSFWRLMGDLVDVGPALPYDQRLQRLRDRGIALWDVLHQCQRAGSLDADIEAGSRVSNDFTPLLASQPTLRRVLCNGGTAAQLFRRQVMPGLPADLRDHLQVLQLPSTSPAHAGMTYADKLARWRAALAPVICDDRTCHESA